ncbi:hypothetical protein ACFVYJ_08670 [Pontibacter sp. JAM-7]|uniref:hypothetical protein n=1 Tax=Pontibacter sp. JAM-7 TaxID=3366581 RepID=UPI003AF96C50
MKPFTKLLSTGVTLLVVMAPMPTLAADADNGAALYESVAVAATINGIAYTDANCETCHSAAVYQRENRLIKSLPSLVAMVERCNSNLDVGWFPDEVSDVAAYLNRQYYHF